MRIPKPKSISDKSLRKWIWQVRDKLCIFCRKRRSEDPHHIIRTSQIRLDTEWNMFGVCRICHNKTENSQISRAEEVETANKRLVELGLKERFRYDTGRIMPLDTEGN